MSEYIDYGWNEGFTRSHKIYMPTVISLLPKDGSPIIDLGCGNGIMANYLIEKGYNMYGTDASESGITVAKKKNPERFFVQDLSKDHLPEEIENITFNTIVSTEVIEHLYHPQKYIEFCKGILPINGTLILSTPYHGYFKNIALALANAMDKHYTALWVGGHIKFWSKKTITQLLTEQGFEVISVKGCGRAPLLWETMVVKAILKQK